MRDHVDMIGNLRTNDMGGGGYLNCILTFVGPQIFDALQNKREVTGRIYLGLEKLKGRGRHGPDDPYSLRKLNMKPVLALPFGR